MISVQNIFNAMPLKTDAAPKGTEGLANAFSTLLVAAGLKNPEAPAPALPEPQATPLDVDALAAETPALSIQHAAPLTPEDVKLVAHDDQAPATEETLTGLVAQTPPVAEEQTLPAAQLRPAKPADEEALPDVATIAPQQQQDSAPFGPGVQARSLEAKPADQTLGLAIMASVDMSRAQRAAAEPAALHPNTPAQNSAGADAARAAVLPTPRPAEPALANQAPSAAIQTAAAPVTAQAVTNKPTGVTADPLSFEAPASRQDGLLSGVTSLSRSEAAGAPVQPGTATATLSDVVGTKEWTQRMGTHLIGMHMRGDQNVELSLNPSELGPLSIQVKLSDNQAHLQFFTGHGQVRQALEQAFPQLRESLSEQGITLGNTSVNDQPRQQRESSDQGQMDSTADGLGEQPEEKAPVMSATATSADNEISTYA